MSSTSPRDSTPSSLDADIKVVFDELDWQQLAVFARLSPEQRLQSMFDLCDFARNLIIASERQRNPAISDEDLAARIRLRTRLSHVA